jgi:rare lipoprotein A
VDIHIIVPGTPVFSTLLPNVSLWGGATIRRDGSDMPPLDVSSVTLRNSCEFSRQAGASGCPVGKAFARFAVVLAGAALAACAQSSVGPGKFASSTTTRQASTESSFKAPFGGRDSAGFAKERVSSVSQRSKEALSFGLASSYGEGSQTASGERFNANELTAAHRTLPFGSRVRVTNRSNGRSVVVRINDRGPFVGGRIIDVTPAAARLLGMSGLAPVTIEHE